MKIIVGGAGSVGKSIVAYLSRGNNDVAVVDEDERKLNEVAREWDVMPVLGSVAHPDVLQKAEAGKSDLLIAATESDEVNMIACQAAYSLFNVPRKVARISARVYHKAAWGGLFGDHDIPVDLAVSPEYEIAGAIKRVLQFPGISGICPFAGKKLMLLSFRCPKKSPLLQIPLDHLERAEPDLHIAVVNVIRSGRGFIPGSDDTFHAGDEINLLAAADEVEDVIRAFGLERKDNERVLIFGGDQIAEYLAEALEEDDGIAGCRVIDEDPRSAARLAEHLNNTAVFNGSVMSDVVLAEAGIADGCGHRRGQGQYHCRDDCPQKRGGKHFCPGQFAFGQHSDDQRRREYPDRPYHHYHFRHSEGTAQGAAEQRLHAGAVGRGMGNRR